MTKALAVGIALGLIATSCSTFDGSSTEPGPSISVFSSYLGDEAENFAASMLKFELETGINVNYTGSANFVQDLRERVDGAVNAPDVAIIPQPALIRELVESDDLVPLADSTLDTVLENYDLTERELRILGSVYAIPYRSTIKSLVWYRPDVFDDKGWEIPATMDELAGLVEQIDSDENTAPWCFSISSGSATGWPATDWVEDLVLRRAGPEAYDEWVDGDRTFADPSIEDAFTEFEELVLRNGRTVGGLRSVLSVEIANTNAPLFTDPPGCAMYKQAAFAESFFPSGTDIGADGDINFFILPGAELGKFPPLLTGGESAVQFNDSANVNRFMEYLATPDSGREWAKRGGYVSARTSIDPESYYRDFDQRIAELLIAVPITRFDASDMMPVAIGSGLLWTEITSWIAGKISYDELAETVDAARE